MGQPVQLVTEPGYSRDLLDEKLHRVWDKFEAVEKAIEKADQDLSAYKLTANEFRGTLSDQAARLATKEDITQLKATIEIQRLRIDKTENSSANLQGRIWMLAAVVVALQLVVNIAQRFIH